MRGIWKMVVGVTTLVFGLMRVNRERDKRKKQREEEERLRRQREHEEKARISARYRGEE